MWDANYWHCNILIRIFFSWITLCLLCMRRRAVAVLGHRRDGPANAASPLAPLPLLPGNTRPHSPRWRRWQWAECRSGVSVSKTARGKCFIIFEHSYENKRTSECNEFEHLYSGSVYKILVFWCTVVLQVMLAHGMQWLRNFLPL